MLSWLSVNRRRLLQIAGTLLAILLLVLLLRDGGWDEIVNAMRMIKVGDLVWVAILFLYFQWAAYPFSAISSMRLLRICTSTHCPFFAITVV